MRAYGRGFAKRALAENHRRRRESRDALLYALDVDGKIAYVKVQGSETQIAAHFPRNITNRPSWLKKGNAVRIIHRGGMNGYIEITGPGRSIPSTALATGLPSLDPPADAIISGLDMFSATPAIMGVYLTSGVYRISNTLYSYVGESGVFVMGADSGLVMGMIVDGENVSMGDSTQFFAIDAAPDTGYFRWDGFCIGTDGVIDYLKGSTAYYSEPNKPTIPADHVQIGEWILVVGDMTAVTEDRIGAVYRDRETATVELTPQTNDTISWNITNPYPTKYISGAIQDQYGWNYSTDRIIKIELLAGSGTLRRYVTSEDVSSIQLSQSSYSFSFYYVRDQTGVEIPPIISAQIIYPDNGIIAMQPLTLLDDQGDPI